MKKLKLQSIIFLVVLLIGFSCAEAEKSTDKQGEMKSGENKVEKEALDITGKYNFESRSDGKSLVNYHTIEINSDGSYKEAYQPKGDTYVGGSTGTWALNNNTLILTDEGGISVEYKVDGNKLIMGSDSDIEFVFSK
jgi:hypothetical protein